MDDAMHIRSHQQDKPRPRRQSDMTVLRALFRPNAKAHRPPLAKGAGSESGVRSLQHTRNGGAGRRFGGATG